MARETLDEDVDVPCKMSADIQVAGMLTYYILSGGHHPFGRSFRCECNIYEGTYNLQHVKDVIATDIIKWMINTNPKERPSVEQCLAHPFFWTTSRQFSFFFTFGKNVKFFIRKIEYLRSIGNEEEVRNYKTTDKCLLDEMDLDVGEAIWKNWKQKVERERERERDFSKTLYLHKY
ncbi:Serine/threonine-protein kinase/endoribonuclease IRE1 [Merluccius polli]|uniref:Serine/threonine-protein kinase/endoribonuclease IRE1 n=1 Tax=Merluccius polli TaxID=89951 RepID=A0AA47M1X6_MERPO|nr:Serine/threonine-protein kinase/endoribonuclease IRE1 [Merluccius polli]